jgi:hypothetical protein
MKKTKPKIKRFESIASRSETNNDKAADDAKVKTDQGSIEALFPVSRQSVESDISETSNEPVESISPSRN